MIREHTFQGLRDAAARAGMTLERGKPSACYGARTGYILTIRGLWAQYGRLEAVSRAISQGHHTRKGDR